MIADVHNHALPHRALDWLRAEGSAVGVRLETGVVVHDEGFRWPLTERFTEPDLVLADLAARGIDAAVLSVPPPLLLHEADAGATAELVDAVNEGLLELAAARRDRFRVLGSVLLQDPAAAAAGVRRLAEHELCAGVQLGVSLDGPRLDDPALDELWVGLAATGLLALVHPVYVGPMPGLEDRYLTNVVGNPLLTTATAMRIIASDLLEREPAPRVLLAHGGGFLRYQLGRLAHASRVRPELGLARGRVLERARGLLYDTITHDAHALRFLVEAVGPDHVLLGSDAPFDMADEDPLATLRAASPEAFEQVSAGNLARLLGGRGFGELERNPR